MNSLCKRLLAFSVLLLVAVAPALAGAGEANSKKGVIAVLNMQADAWNRGDLDAFMTGYLKSPDTSYTSGGEEFWGYESLRKKYAHSYGTNHDTMGKLTFTDLRIVEVGKEGALCVGHWHLERKESPLIEGIFSLVFVKTTSGWKIVHDHTTAGLKKKDS